MTDLGQTSMAFAEVKRVFFQPHSYVCYTPEHAVINCIPVLLDALLIVMTSQEAAQLLPRAVIQRKSINEPHRLSPKSLFLCCQNLSPLL